MDGVKRAAGFPLWWDRDFEPVQAKLRLELDQRFFGHQREHIARAMALAERAHQGQERKGGGPYLIHPFRVALSLMGELNLKDPLLIQAALLHDVLEDSDISQAQLSRNFGNSLATLAGILTRPPRKGPRNDLLQDRYFQKILQWGDCALLVKAADKLDNLRDSWFHPKPAKKKIYEKEARHIFLPLIGQISDQPRRRMLLTAFDNLLQAMNPCHLQETRTYFKRELKQILEDLNPGESRTYQLVAAQIYELDHCLREYLLVNPELGRVWVVSDGISLIKSVTTPQENACNVAHYYRRFISHKGPASLSRLVSIPQPFLSQGVSPLWQRVLDQLALLERLLKRQEPPGWLTPLFEDPMHLLQVIHSRMYMPPSWTFPLWQQDFGASLAGEDTMVYRGLAEKDAIRQKWCAEMAWLLSRREALWRHAKGLGSATRARAVLEILKKSACSKAGFRRRLAARLLAEYLDICTLPGQHAMADCEETFESMWCQFEAADFDPVAFTKKWPQPAAKMPPNPADGVEIINWHVVWRLYLDQNARDSLLAFTRHLIQIGGDLGEGSTLWLCFNAVEITKRANFFLHSMRLIHSHHDLDGIAKVGVTIAIHHIENGTVWHISPGLGPSLKNRLPEARQSQMEWLERQQFSAIAIFDTFLTEPLAKSDTEDPLWMPRVFRALDTMADFNPDGVQKITVCFESREPIDPFVSFLPLPRSSREIQDQSGRKALLARFIVTTVFNVGNTIGIFAATADCGPLAAGDREHGFSNLELENEIAAICVQYGYGEVYGNFFRNFNYRRFAIATRVSRPKNPVFRAQDMSYGRFVGIDIGGTDTKCSFLEQGQVCAAGPDRGTDVITFSTFEAGTTPVDVACFFDRIIGKIEANYPAGWTAAAIHGFGISWPGAVLDNRIAGVSWTLAQIRFPGIGIIDANASPEIIQSADFLGWFRKRLVRQHLLWDKAALILENDGNAEAFGNNCLLTRDMQGPQQGKIIVKLGTSLAGGYVDGTGAVPDHVAEFSKVLLDFNVAPHENAARFGAARNFVSSIGVRRLSRGFVFDGQHLFGGLRGLNASEAQKETRIEAVELGELLDFWLAADEEPLNQNTLLDELTAVDAATSGPRFKAVLPQLANWLSTCEPQWNKGEPSPLESYVIRRGLERMALAYQIPKDDLKQALSGASAFRKHSADFASQGLEVAHFSEFETRVRKRGLARLALLVCGREVEAGELGASFFEVIPAIELAQKVLGTVALFSRFGSHIAHLIIAVYNLYRKRRMSQVILAGGVLGGKTGALVKRQTEAFLTKYYDKVYGPGKNLEPGSIMLARAPNPQAVGPLGVAMLANRRHKMQALAEMEKMTGFLVDQLAPGSVLSLHDLKTALCETRVRESEMLEQLGSFVSRAILFPRHTGNQPYYVKSIVS